MKVFNGNFVASTRLLFALGRRGLVDRRLSRVHAMNQTPSLAIAFVTLGTVAGLFLGDAILIPVSEVGSVASAVGWLAACLAYLAMRPTLKKRIIALAGITAGALMILMKIVPAVPGSFSRAEWFSLLVWALLGFLLSAAARRKLQTAGTRGGGD